MKNVIVRLAVALLVPTAAWAEPSVHFLDRDARLLCEIDARSLCVDAGREDLEACLVDHVDAISDPDCRHAVESAKSQVRDFLDACRFDIDTNCSGIDYGSDLLVCLKSHRRELSGNCRSQI